MISIIVPVYKVEPYLRQCVDSILNQTYYDIEVLLIDDGSPDLCGEICDEYAKNDQRIKVFHTENRGLSAARNLGLQKAQGEYIGFVDSDDWIEADMYEMLLKRMLETQADISVCGLLYEYPQYSQSREIIKKTVYSGLEAIQALIVDELNDFVWNKLYRKECWENLSFPEGHVFEDVVTIYMLFTQDVKVSTSSYPFYHYRQRIDSIAQTRSFMNLVDYWNAYFFVYMNIYPLLISEDKCFIIKLKGKLANAAVKTWRWVYIIPKEKRDYEYLYKVSHYIRRHFPLFGYKQWRFYLRMSVFFVHYVNEVSFAILYIMNRLYRIAINWREHTMIC